MLCKKMQGRCMQRPYNPKHNVIKHDGWQPIIKVVVIFSTDHESP